MSWSLLIYKLATPEEAEPMGGLEAAAKAFHDLLSADLAQILFAHHVTDNLVT
jgi:hypothetical protein